MRTFFICGFPRSRTAWLANFLTTSESYCFHDLLVSCGDMSEIKDHFSLTGKGVVGNSDSGNTLFIDSIIKYFPHTKIVLVKRKRSEVKKSLIEYGIGVENASNEQIESALDLCEQGIKNIEQNFNCISVNFEDLNKSEICENIFSYCTGLPFDYQRWELLNSLNIQADKEVVREKIKIATQNILHLN